MLDCFVRRKTCYAFSFRYLQCYSEILTLSMLPFLRTKNGKLSYWFTIVSGSDKTRFISSDNVDHFSVLLKSYSLRQHTRSVALLSTNVTRCVQLFLVYRSSFNVSRTISRSMLICLHVSHNPSVLLCVSDKIGIQPPSSPFWNFKCHWKTLHHLKHSWTSLFFSMHCVSVADFYIIYNI